MIRLREHNFKRIEELRERKNAVEEWRSEHNNIPMNNRAEKLALANVVVDHLSNYIKAYEIGNTDLLIESAIRHVAVCKVAIQILADR